MEVVHVPNFVTGKEISLIMYRLQLLSVLARRLPTSRVVETDITVKIMKILAYLKPLPGVSYLNDMQDKLKDLVFHLHLNNGKTDKMASLDLTEAKEDFFPKDMSENLSKLLPLQGLLKKEHKKCVEMFEKYTLDLFRQGNTEYVRKIIDSKRASLMDREQILRNQLETLSIQLAILIEKHVTKTVRSLRYDLKKLAKSSDAPSEIMDFLQVVRPDRVSHQIYLEACDAYTYPSRPQNLIYCSDCNGYVPASVSSGSCERDLTVPDNINSNVNASTDRLAACQTDYATALKTYMPVSGRGLRINKGDTVKTKLESSGGDWRFGFKKTAFGLKKTWGFFPTSAVAKLNI